MELFGVGRCCCIETRPCVPCEDELSPANWKLVVSGVVDQGCSNCSDMNGTYIVPWVNDCRWRLLDTTVDPCSCPSGNCLSIGINIDDIGGGDYRIWGFMFHRNGVATENSLQFEKIYVGAKPDCDTLVDEVLALFQGADSPACSGASATFKLTAA